MPIDYKKYPKNWKWLSKQVVERGQNCCELCFVKNHSIICRDEIGQWWGEAYYDGYTFKKKTKIVLTVHHINFNLEDSHPLNLIALCQRCHCKLDLHHKIKNRKRR